MKVTDNAKLLTSLNSLLDPAQRQQQTLQNQQERNKAKQSDKIAEETDQAASRQSQIEANREALAKLQERLKTDRIKKLQAEFSPENSGGADRRRGANLNLRESFGTSAPADSRPGQIIDIRV